MKTILVLSQKGGTGKSLIADELAFSMARTATPFSFYDLDKQGGCLHQTAKNPSAEAAIVDTPGHLQEQMGAWAAAADLTIIPVRPSANDMQPFIRTTRILSDNMKPGAAGMFVLNCWTRHTLARDFTEWLHKRIDRKNFAILPQSELYAQAGIRKKSIAEFAKGSAPAKAMLELCNKARALIGLPPEEEK